MFSIAKHWLRTPVYAMVFLVVPGLFSGISAQQQATITTGGQVLLYSNHTWKDAKDDALFQIQPSVSPLSMEPSALPGIQVVHHTGYSLGYSEPHEQPQWVAYILTAEALANPVERNATFQEDALVTTGTASDQDYQGAGYDRGHMAPALDMSSTEITMKESFLYSNVSPQTAGFNRGIWKRLETQVRAWAKEEGAVYVVTGPLLKDGLPVIGSDSVSVPDAFFKVILEYKAPGAKGIGFILPAQSSDGSLMEFAVTIDSVEKATGIDFFPALPDDQEQLIESSLPLYSFQWLDAGTPSDDNDDGDKRDVAVQCKGLTNSGKRCKNMTRNLNGYCHLHQNQAPSMSTPAPAKPGDQ